MIETVDDSALQALLLEPDWPAACDGTVSALVVVFSAPRPQLSPAEVTWLASLPVPSIAVAAGEAGAAFDLAVPDTGACDRLCAVISAQPAATAMLCRLTRFNAALAPSDALVVESTAYATLQGGAAFRRWLAGRQPRGAGRLPGNPVSVERIGSRLTITLNDPDRRNALSVPMRDGLREAFRLVAQDGSIEKVIVQGRGPSFCAGGDLGEFGTATDLAEAHRIRLFSMPAGLLAADRGRYEFRLHGACIGAGIELPAFAARVVASPDSWFRLPEVGMGLIPGAGGTVSIPARIGRQRFNDMALTGRQVSAEEALRWGRVDAISDGIPHTG